MPRYVKLPDDPTFWYVDEDEGRFERVLDQADLHRRGLYPVHTVVAADLEAIRAAIDATSEGDEEE